MMEECRSYLALVLCFVMATSPLQAPAVASGTAVKARVAGKRWSDGHASQFNNIFRDAHPSPRLGLRILHNKKEDLVRSASLYSGVQSGAIQAASQIVAASLPGQTTTLMPDGRWLLLGGRGNNGPLAAAFFKNPNTGVVTQLPNGLLHARFRHVASLVPSQRVAIGGILQHRRV